MKPWHRDIADPMHRDPPDMPEAYLDEFIRDRDITIDDLGPGEGWEITVQWGNVVEYNDWTDRRDEAQYMIDKYLRKAAERSYMLECEE